MTTSWRVVGAVLGAGLLLASCGDAAGGPDEAAVRPFDEVQDGAFAFELDPTDPSRGIFRVTTTEPMICAIVWGTDASFGRFNNSLAMSGTGIVDHDVVLPDVEPGTTYTYVVQGTTADGTLYRSEIGTFRFDPEPATTTATAEPPGENVALEATVVDVSSEFSPAFAAGNAIDDDTATEWSTAGDGDDGSITLELAAPAEIVGMEFVTRSMADGSATTSTYTVRVDGGEPYGPFPAGTLAAPRPAELVAVGRTLRFDVEQSSGGNVGAVEIRVYAPSP